MRLWSISFKYLDSKGLVALWREALLAKAVLENKTKGYKMHPQLERFKDMLDPIAYINKYLFYIATEATNRNYKFDHTKYSKSKINSLIKVTKGQLLYEYSHLKNKLKIRDIERFNKMDANQIPEAMPLIEIVEGDIESWEVSKS